MFDITVSLTPDRPDPDFGAL